MKYAHLLIALLFGFSVHAQTEDKEKLSFPEFGWSIPIPENFERVDEKEWTKMQGRGRDMIEDTYGEEVINHAKTLFVYTSGQMNYLEANYQPYDASLYESYEASCRDLYAVLHETFTVQMPGVNIDTLITTEQIDDVEFMKFDINIQYSPELSLRVLMYNHLFDDKDFTVNIMYVEESKGQQMLEAWRKSRFKERK